MAKKIKVRFNLGKGKNYMKWKVEFPTHSEYYSPDDTTLALFGCQLKNHKKTAEKINQGANKSVCAWILCDNVFLTQNIEQPKDGVQLKYNPRTQPNWLAGAAVVDNEYFDHIWSDGRKLFGKK